MSFSSLLSRSVLSHFAPVAVWVSACIVIHPFLRWYGFTARSVPSINKNFLLLEGFVDLFSCGEKLVFRDLLFGIFERKRLVKFEVFVAVFFNACTKYHKDGYVCLDVYKLYFTLTHTFSIARITIRKILFSGLVGKYYAKTTLDLSLIHI